MASNSSDNSGDVKGKRISAGVLQSITTLLILCAKQTIIASKKLKKNTKISPGTPRKLISSISNKAIKLRHRKKKTGEEEEEEEEGDGVWRREILMGDKCQPLDFSGVIYYDKNGKLLSEFPVRSPLASPLPGYVSTPARSGWSSTPRRELSSQ